MTLLLYVIYIAFYLLLTHASLSSSQYLIDNTNLHPTSITLGLLRVIKVATLPIRVMRTICTSFDSTIHELFGVSWCYIRWYTRRWTIDWPRQGRS